MFRKFFDSSLRLGLPTHLSTVDNKVLFTLWREGSQCVANIGVLAGVDTSEVTDAVSRLQEAGKVRVDGDRANPFSMCSLGNRVQPRSVVK
ncbi:MAG: hypothetical protein RL033_3327 [Pseudomonadota bacterium]